MTKSQAVLAEGGYTENKRTKMLAGQQRTNRGDKIEYHPVNERLMYMKAVTSHENPPEVVYDDRDDISSVTVDNIKIRRGTVVFMKRRNRSGRGHVMIPFKVNHIEKGDKDRDNVHLFSVYWMAETRRTLSARFILPMLGGFREAYGWSEFMVDSFVGDETREDFSDPYNILILYRFDPADRFAFLEQNLTNMEYFLERYEPDRYHTMYAFQIPEEYHQDHEMFLQGRYSQMSEAHKERVLGFHLGKDPDTDKLNSSVLAAILYKKEWYRKRLCDRFGIDIPEGNELASLPQMRNELYQRDYQYVDVLDPEDRDRRQKQEREQEDGPNTE